MISTVIIEDEINSRELLVSMLTRFCDDIKILGTAQDVTSGIEVIKSTKPELVLLDIEMPGGNGFDILDACNDKNFKVVFVTGYNKYAIRAIKYSALNYILKPVNLDELLLTIKKVNDSKKFQNNRITLLKENYTKKSINKIILVVNGETLIINLKDISYIQADQNYCSFKVKDELFTVEKSINFYIDLLPKSDFFRIHKSYVINKNSIDKLEKRNGAFVHLLTGEILPIASRRTMAFNSFLNS